MKFRSILLIPFVLAACGGMPEPEVGPPVEIASSSSFLSIQPAPGLSETERSAVEQIIAATKEIVYSDLFATRLTALEKPNHKLWLAPSGPSMSPTEVAQIYLGKHATIRPAPTIIALKEKGNPTAQFTGGTTLTSTVTLPRYVLERWASDSPERRACAVNTMAHEIAHTFSRNGRFVFVDGRKGFYTSLFNRPLVSYTVGTVAQCTMLETQGLVSAETFAACIEKWGTEGFNSTRCT